MMKFLLLLTLILTRVAETPVAVLDKPDVAAESSTPDPRGVWLYAWTGSSSGTSWVSIRALGKDRFRVADLRGRGFEFTLDKSGRMNINGPDGASGSGWFSCSDRAAWDLAPAAESNARRHGFLMRAPSTDADVLLVDELGRKREPVPGPTKLSGPWNAVGQEISSTTGDVVRERELTCDIDVRGPRVRISFADGSFDQGVFVTQDRFWFHVVHPPAALVEPAPEGAMATTRNHDILGFGRVLDDDRIELLFLLETRGAVGKRIQLLFRYRFER